MAFIPINRLTAERAGAVLPGGLRREGGAPIGSDGPFDGKPCPACEVAFRVVADSLWFLGNRIRTGADDQLLYLTIGDIVRWTARLAPAAPESPAERARAFGARLAAAVRSEDSTWRTHVAELPGLVREFDAFVEAHFALPGHAAPPIPIYPPAFQLPGG